MPCPSAAAIAAFILLASSAVHAQESVIHSFGGPSDGNTPRGNLIADSHGNLYGATYSGGALGWGTVYELSPESGGDWTEKVLYSFGTSSSDGTGPLGALVFDTKGNLYGTTSQDGANSYGTVFELTPATDGTWTEKTLHSFAQSASDGENPMAGLILDSKGNLYGTTNAGGAGGDGTVFELTPQANATWSESILYAFGSSSNDGIGPSAPLVFDARGNLYGTTAGGGSYAVTGYGAGTVFELQPGSGAGWTEKILYNFGASSADASDPVAGVVFDSAGNIYGTTEAGGASQGGGTVFELSPSGATWREHILHSFPLYVTTDGGAPMGGLVFDSQGDLYGTTENYGFYGTGGIVFELTPAANGVWNETLLHSFHESYGDAGAPTAGVVFSSPGSLVGTTNYGGGYGAGAVFEIQNVNQVASPQFSAAPGHYATSFSLKLTDATSGAVLYYTTNGENPTSASTRYTAPIDITGSETVKALATAAGQPESPVVGAAYIVGAVVAAPTFSLAAGTYDAAQTLTLADATPGAVLHYTTNGSAPTASSPVYAAKIAIAKDTTVQAIATESDYVNSPVVSRTYVVAAAKPVFSVPAGTYTAAQTVKLSDSTPAATIYYTTNGATPTTASARYTAPILIGATKTLKAAAIAIGFSLSPAVSATYTITPPAATPTFSPAAGTYAAAQTVILKDATPGATVYWTRNGAKATTSSAKYTGPIAVSATETINAIAIAPGYSVSADASALITIETPAATPKFSVAAGSYKTAQSVTITDATAGAAIYYTTNGATPTTSSAKYTGPIAVGKTETLEAIAKGTQTLSSVVAKAAYTIQ